MPFPARPECHARGCRDLRFLEGPLAERYGILTFTSGLGIHLIAKRDLNRYGKEGETVLVGKDKYSFLKHPMYVGGSLAYLGATVAARSYIGFLLVWVWVPLIAVCGYLEGVKLRRDLPPGTYDEYARRAW